MMHVHGDHKIYETRVSETLTLILGRLHGDTGFCGCTAQARISEAADTQRAERREKNCTTVAGACSKRGRSSRITSWARLREVEGRGAWVYVCILFVAQGQEETEFRVGL